MSRSGPYAFVDRGLALVDRLIVDARIALGRRARSNGHAAPIPLPFGGEPGAFRLVDAPTRPEGRPAVRTPGDVNMSDRQLAFIEHLAKKAPLRRFLEIGVFKGVTTSILAQVGETVAIDWFQGNYEAARRPETPSELEVIDRRSGFLEALDSVGVRDRVTVLEGSSHDILPRLRGNRFGLAIVDADHSEAGAYADIRDTWPLVAPGGFLVLDDFSLAEVGGGFRPDVRRAWDRFSAEMSLAGISLLTADADGPPKTIAVRRAA